jgi:hypothetical protein
VLKTLQERLQSDHELELSLSWRLATSEFAAMTLSVPQITAQLEAVLAREPGALAIAIRSAGKQDWPDGRHATWTSIFLALV